MAEFVRAGAGWITKDGQKIRFKTDCDIAEGDTLLVEKNKFKKGERDPDYKLTLIVEDDHVNEQAATHQQPSAETCPLQQPTQKSCPF